MFPDKKWKFMLCLLPVVFLLQGCNSSDESEAVYSRSDCIVRVDLYWPDTFSYDDKVDVTNEIRIPASLRGIAAGYAIPVKGEPDLIYIQYFPQGCDKKHDLSEKFFNELRSKINDFPSFVISKDLILPSTRTIKLTGSAWKD
ncbi:MAG: hypothetical protein RNU03_01275 [Candidatus Sedimenticola sp. (ex Thyasira tokunagai)]